MRIASIDSSALINLTHLGLTAELSVIFDLVYVPRAVQKEVNRRGRFRYHLNKLYETGFYTPCVAADRTNVRLLQEDVDEGEAEALSQCQERNAQYFIADEKSARGKGEILGLKCVGTVRILARLHLEGQAEEPKALVRKLQRDLRFRVSERVLRQALAMAAEPI